MARESESMVRALDTSSKEPTPPEAFADTDSTIQTGTIVKMATGEVFETMNSAFSYDKDLVSPICTIIKRGRYSYLLVSGISEKIMVKKLN